MDINICSVVKNQFDHSEHKLYYTFAQIQIDIIETYCKERQSKKALKLITIRVSITRIESTGGYSIDVACPTLLLDVVNSL